LSLCQHAKLAANEARLGFMRKTKDLTQGIKHQFDRLNEWRKDHGLTFHDINEALKADRQEYKENFAEKWDGIKDSFNNTVEKVHDSIQEFNDYQAVQQMEAERQMNMRLLSIEGTKAVQCEEQIHKLALRREKIINTVNKAITFGNKCL
jgi:gas vesicle protein